MTIENLIRIFVVVGSRRKKDIFSNKTKESIQNQYDLVFFWIEIVSRCDGRYFCFFIYKSSDIFFHYNFILVFFFVITNKQTDRDRKK